MPSLLGCVVTVPKGWLEEFDVIIEGVGGGQLVRPSHQPYRHSHFVKPLGGGGVGGDIQYPQREEKTISLFSSLVINC